jgi:hypothetical protein
MIGRPIVIRLWAYLLSLGDTLKYVNKTPNWSKANCLHTDPELFFPMTTITRKDKIEIHNTCGSCVIRLECERFGKDTKSVGVWGGKYLNSPSH